MQWELSPELFDEVVYAMENQDRVFFYDVEGGNVVSEDDLTVTTPEAREGSRYYEVPEWRSHEGFHLMERFVADLRNPVTREHLRDALSSGRGVFRQFKNAIKSRPDIERLWFAYKERAMRKIVLDWLNDIRELNGLQKLDPAPEEEVDEELILSDFLVARGTGDRIEELRNLDRQFFDERFPDAPAPARDDLYAERREGVDPGDPSSLVVRAETPSGEIAGFVWAAVENDPLTGLSVASIIEIGVVVDYRGLGLGRTLLEEAIRCADAEGLGAVDVHVDGAALATQPLWSEMGFDPIELSLRRSFAPEDGR